MFSFTNGGLGRLDVLAFVNYLFDFVGVDVQNLMVLPDHHVGREHHRESDNQPETHLTDNLEFAAHAVLVVAGDFKVVVGETETPEPHGGHKHQNHVDVAQVAHQQAGHERRHYDDYAAHSGGACLFHLPLQPEIAHDFAYLHLLQAVDYATAEHHGDEQREQQGRPRAEGDVIHQARSGHSRFT